MALQPIMQHGGALRPRSPSVVPPPRLHVQGLQPRQNLSTWASGRPAISSPQHAQSGEKASAARPTSHVTQSGIHDMALTGEYDASSNASVWERRPVPVISRLIKIGVEFMLWQVRNPDEPPPKAGQAEQIKTAVSKKSALTPRKAKRAAAMRDLLVQLGPAFVKIGQALSSRPDILPPNYLVELEALQDRIPAFDTQEAFKVLEAELGAPLGTVFSEISPEPVAAASLGQVYRARLARDGQEVAVKVQRPGVAEAIALDVFILRWLAAAFRKWRKLNTDLPALVDEWATSLFRELDYRREAQNAQRFRQLYSQLEGVYVPVVFPELTTAKVLTMEWVDGERLRTVADNVNEKQSTRRLSAAGGGGSGGMNISDLALVEVGVRCSLEQMLEEGFYHADPHPGNLLRTKDGKLAYLDFGMCGELDQKTRQALIRATLHLVNREYAALSQDFIDLGLLPPGSDKEKIIPALTGVFQKALNRGVSNVSFGDLSGELGRTMYQFSFRIPPYYTLLVRSLTVLEGIALASDSNYKVLGSAYPWIARRLLTNQTPELQETLRALLYQQDGTFRFSRLESLLEEATRTPRGASPAALAANTTAAAGNATETTPARSKEGGALALVLSPDANFVRGILLDETAKGIDAGWRVAIDNAVNSALFPLPSLQRVPVLGSFLAPLVAPLTTTGRNPWDGFSSASHRLQGPSREPHLAGPAGDLLASIPHLASSQDRQQLDGIGRLANALSDLAAARTASQGTATANNGSAAVAGDAGVPVGGPLQVASQLQQAAEALRWLLAEVSALPANQQAEALRIPAELASRIASRLSARALRGIFAERPETYSSSSSSASSSTSSAAAGTVSSSSARGVTPEAVAAPVGDDAVQNALVGSSIV